MLVQVWANLGGTDGSGVADTIGRVLDQGWTGMLAFRHVLRPCLNIHNNIGRISGLVCPKDS